MQKTFRYSTGAYSVAFRNLFLGLGTLIFFAAVFGQIQADRFPSYTDLGIAILIPVSCYIAVTGILYALSFVYTVRLTDTAISGSNAFGFFLSADYDEIENAFALEMSGFPYIVIESQNNISSIYIPVWLEDFEDFCASILHLTPTSNPLHKLISENC